ncbi:hypothetical protein MC885_000336 [Smutsia gigantea]|nr:hypothetical protein MC885_000336 [Smutsia gigantea]
MYLEIGCSAPRRELGIGHLLPTCLPQESDMAVQCLVYRPGNVPFDESLVKLSPSWNFRLGSSETSAHGLGFHLMLWDWLTVAIYTVRNHDGQLTAEVLSLTKAQIAARANQVNTKDFQPERAEGQDLMELFTAAKLCSPNIWKSRWEIIPSDQDAPPGAVIWLLALFIWAAAHPQTCQGSLRAYMRLQKAEGSTPASEKEGTKLHGKILDRKWQNSRNQEAVPLEIQPASLVVHK